MADYNLGTARGQIVVDYDQRGSKQAQSDFEAIAQKANWLAGRLAALSAGIATFGSDVENSISRASRSFGLLVGGAAVLTGLLSSTQRLSAGLLGLRGGLNIVGALGISLRGLPANVQGFPNVIKQVILLASAIQLFGASTGILSTIVRRFSLLAPLSGGIRQLGESVTRLGRPVSVVAGLALAFGNLISVARASTSIAGAVIKLGGAIAGLGAVTFVVLGLAQALMQLSGVVGILPGAIGGIVGVVATLATGLSGVSKALQFVQPAGAAAAGGMNQAATAARNAARAIAAAQRSLEDALRDQARTARDSARAVAEAQRALSDAVQDAADIAVDAARRIADAQRSLREAVADAARAARDSARAIADAQDNLADAFEDAARSARDSARAIEDAQRSQMRTARDTAAAHAAASRRLSDAYRNEQRAQESLNRARADAIRMLDDLQERVSDLALDQEGASIALIEAQKNQVRVNNDALSTDLDRRRAAYEVAVAQERLSDIEREAAQAAAENASAQAKGVDGSEQVVRANEEVKDAIQAREDAMANLGNTAIEREEALADAARRVADAQEAASLAQEASLERISNAQRSLADAQEQSALSQQRSAQRIADAQQSLADAHREGAQANEDAARRIQDAQTAVALAQERSAEANEDAARRVADAQRSLAEAHEDAAQSIASSAAKMAGAEDPINKLSPAARAAVMALRGLKDEWETLRTAVQEALFQGVAGHIESLATIYLPKLQTGMVNVATALNGLVTEFVAFMKQRQTIADFELAWELLRQTINNLRPAIQPLFEAFRDIGIVGMQVLRDLTGGAGGAAQGFADFIARARESGQLYDWMQAGIQAVRDLWNIILNVGHSLQAIWDAVTGEGGQTFLGWLRDVTTQMRLFLESAEGQEAMRTLGEFVRDVMARAFQILKIAFEELGPVIFALMPFFSQLAGVIGTVLVAALRIAGPLLEGIANALSWMAPVIAPIVGFFFAMKLASVALGLALGPLIRIIGLVTQAWKILKFAFITNPWIGIIVALAFLVGYIIANWDTIKNTLWAAWEWIKTTAIDIWNKITGFFKTTGDDIKANFQRWSTDLKTDWNNFWSGIWEFLKGIWNNITSFLSNTFNDVKTRMSDNLNQVSQSWNNTWNGIWTFFSDLWARIVNFFSTQWDNFVARLQNNLNRIQDAWNRTWNNVYNFFSNLWNRITSFFSNAWTNIANAVSRGASNVWNAVRNLGNDIIRMFSDAGNWLISAGKNIVIGLWNGIVSRGRWLWDQIMNWVRTYVPGPILQFLGIASPSEWMRDEVGRMVPAGIMVGFDDMKTKLASAAKTMVERAAGAASSAAQASNLGADILETLPQSGVIASAAAATRGVVGATVATAAPATATVEGAEGGPRTVNIEKLILDIAGNLDPTNPLAWREAMKNIHEGLRRVERSTT